MNGLYVVCLSLFLFCVFVYSVTWFQRHVWSSLTKYKANIAGIAITKKEMLLDQLDVVNIKGKSFIWSRPFFSNGDDDDDDDNYITVSLSVYYTWESSCVPYAQFSFMEITATK